MVAGDIINHIGTSFTPAVGVEIIILISFANNIGSYFGISDGVNSARNYGGVNNVNNSMMYGGSKFGITNNYPFISTGGATTTGFSGIQIK